MRYVDLSRAWTSGYSKDYLLSSVNEEIAKIRASLPVYAVSSMRITFTDWDVLDKDWPGGNEREWFTAKITACPHPAVTYHIILDVVISIDRSR